MPVEVQPLDTAGELLMEAVAALGLTVREEGHASADSFWLEVDIPGHGEVWISGGGSQENKIHYLPGDHQGWVVMHYPDPEEAYSGDGGIPLHDSDSVATDFTADTALVLAAIRALTAGPPAGS